MNTTELVRKIANESGYSQDKVRDILKTAESIVKTSVMEGESLKCLGLTFTSKIVSEHEARNPLTGETVVVPDRRRVSVKQSADWKRLAKESEVE